MSDKLDRDDSSGLFTRTGNYYLSECRVPRWHNLSFQAFSLLLEVVTVTP